MSMDRFAQFGLRGEADETLRRAVRDGFRRAGLSHGQLTEALQWYRDTGQHLGGDPEKLVASFTEFAAAKNWPAPHLEAAVGGLRPGARSGARIRDGAGAQR